MKTERASFSETFSLAYSLPNWRSISGALACPPAMSLSMTETKELPAPVCLTSSLRTGAWPRLIDPLWMRASLSFDW